MAKQENLTEVLSQLSGELKASGGCDVPKDLYEDEDESGEKGLGGGSVAKGKQGGNKEAADKDVEALFGPGVKIGARADAVAESKEAFPQQHAEYPKTVSKDNEIVIEMDDGDAQRGEVDRFP